MAANNGYAGWRSAQLRWSVNLDPTDGAALLVKARGSMERQSKITALEPGTGRLRGICRSSQPSWRLG